MKVGIDFFVGGGVLSAAILQQILGGDGSGLVEASVTTAGDGALTAGALTGGVILRTGPTAAFTDTLADAEDIVDALGENISVGQTFLFYYKNNTAYQATLAAGAGMTLPATVKVPPFQTAIYYGTVGGTQDSPTVELTHVASGPLRASQASENPLLTALGGTGNATITAAGINGGVTTRTAQTAARTDTTDTAANIIAGNPALAAVGGSFKYRYVNNGIFPITIAGGTGVTPSVVTVVPPNSWVDYVLTKTGAATIDMVAVGQGYFPSVGVTPALNGATPVTVVDARVTASSNILLTLKTVGGTVSPNAPNIQTITPGTGFTVAGTALDTSVYNYEIRG